MFRKAFSAAGSQILLVVLCCVASVSVMAQSPANSLPKWPNLKTGRSIVRSTHGMVASSQPLASQVGLEVLKKGGNAVDAAIAMAAVLNVTEPMMTGVGGDMFAIVYWAKTGELKGLNASGRAPQALNLEYFQNKGMKRVPLAGMEPITVPGAFDGWCTLRDKYGTMPLSELLQPAIHYAQDGYPVMEKAAEDWAEEVNKLKRTPAAAETYLLDGRAPQPGEIFKNPHLAATLRTLAQGGRKAFYNGPIGRAMVDYFQKNGGFITLDDLRPQHAEWVDPISTTYRGYTAYELPPNGQGLTALIALNILEGFDLASLKDQPDLYQHLRIEAIKLAFADRNRYIADPHFAKIPLKELLSKEYAAKRRALIHPDSVIANPQAGEVSATGDTTYFTVVDKDHNAVSFINSLFEAFGSGIVAGDTGIVLQDRGAGFSLDPNHPNHIEPGKRPFHTLIPAMLFKDGKFLMSYGVMGGDIQAQGHVQVLTNLIDMGMNLQQAIEAPRFRYLGGERVYLEPEMGEDVIQKLIARGHQRASPPNGMTSLRGVMGGGQAIMIDFADGSLMGGSDNRKDGMALGY